MKSMLHQLEKIIDERKINPQPDSYTNSLFDEGRNKITQKVGEEATEVIVAALGQSKDEQISELSDLFYHVLVLMAELEIDLSDVENKLHERHITQRGEI